MIVVHLKQNKNIFCEKLFNIYFSRNKISFNRCLIFVKIQTNIYFHMKKKRAMATSCCVPTSHLPSQSKHSEWMRNLPSNLHNEPITKIAIPGRSIFNRISKSFIL
jgi:hypothetical protein